MAWYLNKALTTFRNEVNAVFPNRDKASDGTIGDAAHQASTSDHNPDSDGSVDAWDMDVDLKSGNDAANIEKLKAAFQAHPAARYWIHNRKIANRNNGWKREAYYGASAHTEHVHWNSEPAHEDSTKSWEVKNAIEGDDMTPPELLNYEIKNTVTGKLSTIAEFFQSVNRESYQAHLAGQENAKALEELKVQVEKLSATPPGSVVITDEQLERVLRKVVGSVDNA